MSSKTDFAVKLVLVLFITLLSFSIGTFVGKQYSDNQHQLALLEPSGKSAHGAASGEASREVASVHGEEGAAKSSSMSDEDIAKLAEEFVADETESPAKDAEEATHGTTETKVTANEHGAPAAKESTHAVAKTEAKAEAKAPAHAAAKAHGAAHGEAAVAEHKAEPSTAAKSLAATEKSAVKKERVPSSLPKNVAQYTVGKFTVQVAAYADESEAQKMASDLKKKGYSAFYIPAAVKGQTWYRVSVGQFASQKEAQSYRSELMERAKVSSAIVQKITE